MTIFKCMFTLHLVFYWYMYIPCYPQTHLLMAAGVNGHRGHPVLTHAAEGRRKGFGRAANLLQGKEVSSVSRTKKYVVGFSTYWCSLSNVILWNV